MAQKHFSGFKLTGTDKILEAIGWSCLIMIWLLITVNYSQLPETLPVHYNAMGEADGFKEKDFIWAIPQLATSIFIGLTISIKILQRVYKNPNIIRLIRYIKSIIVVVLTFISIHFILNPSTNKLSPWFLLLIVGIIFIPLIHFKFTYNQD